MPFYDGGNVFRRPATSLTRPTPPPERRRRCKTSVPSGRHTVGLGFRIKTPVGGEFGIDYGHLLNPPVFLIPQQSGPNALYRLRQGHLHFRFAQAF